MVFVINLFFLRGNATEECGDYSVGKKGIDDYL